MSMASPTLRSSSSTVPGPSFKSCPTSIRERPSTAETCTGTSNTASRSAALRPTLSPSPGKLWGCLRSLGAGSPSRFGNVIFLSPSVIAAASGCLLGPARARCEIAVHRIVNRMLDSGAIAYHSAICPFHTAIAGLNLGLGENHEPPFEAVGAHQRFESFAGLRIDGNIDAHHDVGRASQVSQATGHEGADFTERLTINQGRRQFLGDGNRNLHGFGLEPALDVAQNGPEHGNPRRNALKRRRRAARGIGTSLDLRGGKSLAIPLGASLLEGGLMGIKAQCIRLFRCRAGAEIDIKQVFCSRRHVLAPSLESSAATAVRSTWRSVPDILDASKDQFFVAAVLGNHDLALGCQVLCEVDQQRLRGIDVAQADRAARLHLV